MPVFRARNKWPHTSSKRHSHFLPASPFSFSNHFLSTARHPKTRGNLTNKSFLGKSMTKSEPPLNLPLPWIHYLQAEVEYGCSPYFLLDHYTDSRWESPLVCPLYSLRPACHFSLRVFHLLLNPSFIKSFSHVSNYPSEKYSLVRLKLNLPFTDRLNRSLYIYFLIERLFSLLKEEGKLFLCNYSFESQFFLFLRWTNQMQRKSSARLYSSQNGFFFYQRTR